MESTTGFTSEDWDSHDPETSTPLLSSNKRTSKVDPYIKPVMYIIIGCAFLASISFLTAHYSTMKEVVDYSVKEKSAGLARYLSSTKGPQVSAIFILDILKPTYVKNQY